MLEARNRIKSIFLGVLLTVALASSLPAQEPAADLTVPSPEEAWIFVSLATGGTADERKYFNERLPESVKVSKHTLASTMEESDLFITADLAYNYELRLQAITVQLHDSVTGEQIASNAMGYAAITDMDMWNDLLIEELIKDIPRYEHVSRGVKPLTLSERLWGVDRYWLHLGVRGGGDFRFYSPLTAGNTVGYGFDAGVQVMIQVLPFLGIQAEALFTMDFAPQFAMFNNTLNTTKANNTISSLMIPVVLMVPFRPDQWLIAPFGGVYVNIPLGAMTLPDRISGTESTESYQWQDNGKWMGLGWTAGIEVGRKMGPGTLFMDIRFISDLGAMVPGQDNAKYKVKRSGVSVSLGYEFTFFKKKAK